MKAEQLQRLNKMAAELTAIYRKNNVDPKGPRVCRALDLIDAAAYEIAMLANEESNAAKEKGK